ncbi:MarR family transcriptional regulator [Clavibacter michiganensis]|nr:MarR family transcriptional regulator [Clavibacter michiganensis]
MSTSPDDSDSPLDALTNALHLMENAQRHLRNHIAGDLGMNITDFTVIGIMTDLGRMTPKLLATEMSMTTGAITAVIDRLVTADHIARIPNPRDRRSVFLELTPAGTDTATHIQDSYRAAAEAAIQASPDLGSEHTAEDLARAAVAITAHTIDSLNACPTIHAA